MTACFLSPLYFLRHRVREPAGWIPHIVHARISNQPRNKKFRSPCRVSVCVNVCLAILVALVIRSSWDKPQCHATPSAREAVVEAGGTVNKWQEAAFCPQNDPDQRCPNYGPRANRKRETPCLGLRLGLLKRCCIGAWM